MKLDNKGWGMALFIFFIALFVVALAVSVILLKDNFEGYWPETENSNTKPSLGSYTKIEDSMVVSAKKYVADNHQSLVVGDKFRITLYQMQQKKLIGIIYDVKNSNLECDGYVQFSKTETTEKYEPYLKCGSNYKTDGYISE